METLSRENKESVKCCKRGNERFVLQRQMNAFRLTSRFIRHVSIQVSDFAFFSHSVHLSCFISAFCASGQCVRLSSDAISNGHPAGRRGVPPCRRAASGFAPVRRAPSRPREKKDRSGGNRSGRVFVRRLDLSRRKAGSRLPGSGVCVRRSIR